MSPESSGGVTPTERPPLELRVFGSVDLSGSDGAEAILVQPKRVALLTYLVLARPRGFHRRDRLVSLFWPEHSAAPPIVLLQLAANLASVVLVIAPLHLLYINTRLLPPELRPPLWRRAMLVVMPLFYAFFVTLSVRSLL